MPAAPAVNSTAATLPSTAKPSRHLRPAPAPARDERKQTTTALEVTLNLAEQAPLLPPRPLLRLDGCDRCHVENAKPCHRVRQDVCLPRRPDQDRSDGKRIGQDF